MIKRPDLGKAVREALPVYEASPALEAWARDEARNFDNAPVSPAKSSGRSSRGGFWSTSAWRIAAGLVIAAAAGWGAGSLRSSAAVTLASNQTTDALVDTH